MAITSSLPQMELTPLLGRSAEVDAIDHLLRLGGTRLVTLIGPGGVGKTRLAVAAGDRVAGAFPDGVLFVDLAVVQDPALVLPTLAKLLGMVDTGSQPLLGRLQQYLGERAMLLILDNFEHLFPAAIQLPELLATAPKLKILVTSRVPLHLRWERTLRVAPLDLPDPNRLPPLAELVQIPSVALFVDRARAQRLDFRLTDDQAPIVAQLVCQLDGVPLAIELAAARTNVLPLTVIADRLHHRLRLLTWEASDLPERQRSLHAVMSWSYELLSEDERRLFRHLGVFAGRVSLNAAVAVMDEDDEDVVLAAMVSLAEQSLIQPGRSESQDEAELSFGMLETVVKYASELLERAGELEDARNAHARYYFSLAERAEPELRGSGQLVWRRRLEPEQDNLRAALHWLLDHDEHEQALRLVGALCRFWWLRGYYTEGGQWLEQALSEAHDAHPEHAHQSAPLGDVALWGEG